jgi:hypothetical protein
VARSRAPIALRRLRIHRQAMQLAIAERLSLAEARWRLFRRASSATSPDPGEPELPPEPWWTRQ